MRRFWIPVAMVALAALWALLDPSSGVASWRSLERDLYDADRRVAALREEVAALDAEAAALAEDPVAVEAAIRTDLELALPGETVVRVRRQAPMSADSLTR